jgi:MoaA/NifB/PqqE/SkfB family radical SAM enzyme
MKADIKIGFNCNNFCKFCVQGDKRKAYGSRDTGIIKNEMEKARTSCRDIVFTGGEPTLHKDFFQFVAFAKALNFNTIQIQSNGRFFSYSEFCKKAIKCGANEFSPALHGSTPHMHDYLTSSPGSFKQTVDGIINLKKLGQTVITNTVITKSNFAYLPSIADLLIRLGVDQFQFAFPHPLGSAKDNFDSIVPRMSLVEPFVKMALEKGISAGKRVMTEAIPYCFMRGYEDYIAERILPETKIYDVNGVIENFGLVRKKEGKSKSTNCPKCRYYAVCEGPWREYPQKFGWDEFKPVRKGFVLNNKGSVSTVSIFTDISNLLIKHFGLKFLKVKVGRITNILFTDFKEPWLKDNQKFDFSISASDSNARSLRFSYNDFGEKKEFKNKLLKIFQLFGDAYSINQINELLCVMIPFGNKQQTTIGLVWFSKENYPKIKVYFEELVHSFTQSEIRIFLQRICKVLKIDYKKLQINSRAIIGAICVDFLPKKNINLKVYCIHKEVNEKTFLKFLRKNGLNAARKLLKSILNKGESKLKVFYYITKRFQENGCINSIKLYKIYEISRIKDSNQVTPEIRNILINSNDKAANEVFSEICSLCALKGRKVFPVIAAIDHARGSQKADVYFTVK